MVINIKGDVKAHTKHLSKLQKKIIPDATRSSINKTATSVTSAIKKPIAKEIGVRQKDIKKAFYIKRANRKKLTAEITIRPHLRKLIRYPAGEALKAKALANSFPRHGVKGKAFIAKMKTGHRGVFKRAANGRIQKIKTSSSGNRYKSSKIVEIYAASPAQIFEINGYRRIAEEVSRRRFPVVFDQEMRFRLSKLTQ